MGKVIRIEIGIAIEIETAWAWEIKKLDVYRLALRYVAWVFERSQRLDGVHRHARDQWLRATQSAPLNMTEGNGKTAEPDRRRYFEIARGSVLECAAIQNILVVGKALEENESAHRKVKLDRMAAMLSRLGKRGSILEEEAGEYRFDSYFDSDFDPDEERMARPTDRVDS